jgi:hypothetical protein
MLPASSTPAIAQVIRRRIFLLVSAPALNREPALLVPPGKRGELVEMNVIR